MPRRFQVTIQGQGLSVPVDDGDLIRGFFVIRRVLAETPEEAERKAIAGLEAEEKYRWLVQETQKQLGTSNGCNVRLENIGELSWFAWHFGKHSNSFIYYSDEKDETQHDT